MESGGPEAGGRYTHGHEAPTLASHGARTASTSAAYLLPVLRDGMSVLDVGCGPGTITLDLAALVAPGPVTGIENVDEPLRTARQEAARRGDTRTRFERADVRSLPFEDDSFDVVHAHQVLQHLVDPVGALREMVRVCRPGGWVAVRDADYAAMAWHPEVPELEQWRTLYRTMARRNGAEPDAGRRLRAWANAAGLQHAQLSTTAWTYADPDSCRWWGRGQADRVAGPVFGAQAAEHGVGAEEVSRIVAAWQRWGRTRTRGSRSRAASFSSGSSPEVHPARAAARGSLVRCRKPIVGQARVGGDDHEVELSHPLPPPSRSRRSRSQASSALS